MPLNSILPVTTTEYVGPEAKPTAAQSECCSDMALGRMSFYATR